MTTFDERYAAVSAHDRRFDGQFVVAVRTTGVYCRPSCPSRTPKRENVEFLPTTAAAHEAGYRACKRCLPDAAPGAPAWDTRQDAAARAVRMIDDGVVEREGAAGLARRLDMREADLDRLLVAELGAGAQALDRARRVRTAVLLLTATDLPVDEVAAAVGCGDRRRFDEMLTRFLAQTPDGLRARHHSTRDAAGATVAPPVSDRPLRLTLEHRRPADLAGVFSWLRARAVDDVEVVREDSYDRTLALPHGPARLRVHTEGDALILDARPTHPADLATLIARTRRLFDLDADPVAVDEALAAHPAFAAGVRATPGIRVPGALDAGEMLVRAMVGQQITVPAARTALCRLTAALGESLPDGRRLFPTMAAVAAHGAEVLRGPQARIRAVVEAAAALADGTVSLDVGDDPSAQRAVLLALRGVGPWTADYVRMRVTGDTDVFLPGDVAARSGAALLGLPEKPKPLDEWMRRLAPWRSYATAHLWRATAGRVRHPAPRPRPGPAGRSVRSVRTVRPGR